MRRLSVAFIVLALSLAPGSALADDEASPATGSFGPAGSLADSRSGHTATLLPDGRVLLVGGWNGDHENASAEVWDPVTAAFGPSGSLAEARSDHAATLLADGRVLVVGGWRADDALAWAEVWDTATTSFEPAGSLAEARTTHSATLLPDGRVLMGLRLGPSLRRHRAPRRDVQPDAAVAGPRPRRARSTSSLRPTTPHSPHGRRRTSG